MPSKALKVRITTPTETIPFGRGFYQLEEDALYLPIEYPGERPHFFSFIESKDISIQIDRDGRVIFLEISMPRRRWHVRHDLVRPDTAENADIRFLNFRQGSVESAIICDSRQQTVMIRFGRSPAHHNYYLADNLIAQVDDQSHLISIWAFNIADDIAGQELLVWRKAARRIAMNAVLAR